MSKRGARQIVYVCSSIADDRLISHTIEACSSTDAISLFETKYNVKAQAVHGPFYQKKIGVLNNTQNVQFSGQSEIVTYNGWIVNALHLKDPENCAYLLFDHRIDNKKTPKPTGAFIINLDDLRIKQC